MQSRFRESSKSQLIKSYFPSSVELSITTGRRLQRFLRWTGQLFGWIVGVVTTTTATSTDAGRVVIRGDVVVVVVMIVVVVLVRGCRTCK